jgi:signal transduction histidine kinase
MGIILLAYIPALIGMFIVALFVLGRQKQSTHVAFAITLFIMMAWQALQFLCLFLDDSGALWSMRLSLAVSNFLYPTFVLFALLYPGSGRVSARTFWLVFTAPIILTPLSLLPDMVRSVSREGHDLILQTGFLYDIQSVVGVLYMVVALVLLIWKYRATQRYNRGAILMIFIAFLLPLVVGILTNYFFIGVAGTQYILPVTFLGTSLIIAYAMVKHRLFDIRVAAVRGAAYILSLATLAGLYYVMALAISTALLSGGEGDIISQSPFSIALALILAFVFQPVKRFFDRLTNSIFFHDDYNTDDFLATLGQELSVSSDLHDLVQRASSEIGSTIKAEQTFFLVRYGDTHKVLSGTSGHSRISQEDTLLLDRYVDTNGPGVIVSELLPPEGKVHRALAHHKIAIVLPLVQDGRVQSYVFIGRRRSREYTQRDVRVLETIANELAIAIQNALSVQEVRDINATLQQRVNEATKELRATNKQLQRLDTAKDEFVSMASHQLRTPLTSVKGYISMVLEGDVGHISAQQRQLLEEAFTSSERMVHLISDFLNVSRLKTGKFMIDHRPTDLSKLIKQEVDGLQSTATAHNLKLKFRIPTYFPVLYIDEGKIRQVIMNFIDNAIYYSREGTTIHVELSVVDGNAVLQVRDTGIGVPKAEQAHLFTKFFRASNARRQRPDGTGVGLFLAKKVIVAHGGSILFESVENEGSKFGFRLPVKKLSSASDADKLNNQPNDQ